jgi:CheY-like chemotaxis protein
MDEVFRRMDGYKKFKNCRIMVVDDEEFCIEAMKSMLFRAGIDTEYQVDYCISGKEAMEQMINSTENGLSYKLIFTDFSMPVMDGIQATKKMRAYLTEKGKEQPVIIGVTGHVLYEYQ